MPPSESSRWRSRWVCCSRWPTPCSALCSPGAASPPDPTALALLLAAGMCTAIALVPGLKYPANPPTVGLEETIGARSSAFLTITVISVVGACVAVAAGLAWSRRWGGSWPAAAVAVGGYGLVMLVAFVWLPGFHEVPGPISGPDGVLVDGFSGEVLGEFRVYSVLNQALMWLTIGATGACLSALSSSMRRRNGLSSLVTVGGPPAGARPER